MSRPAVAAASAGAAAAAVAAAVWHDERMKELSTWTRTSTTLAGETRDVWRKGDGTGVIVLHEVPGIEPSLMAFAEDVVARGHTVLLPQLFGAPGAGFSVGNVVGDLWRFCVRREFTLFARGRTSPVAMWLRALARQLHDEVGGPGVGVVGMCFTGGFALAMMADAPVVAPVVAEPSLPAAIGAGRADLGLSAPALRAVRESSCDVMGLKYRTDPAVGSRFATLERMLGERFVGVEFEGPGHSVLSADRRDSGVRRVLDFLDERLDGGAPPFPARDAEAEALVRARIPEVVDAVVTRDPLVVELVVAEPLDRADFQRVASIAETLLGVVPDVRLERSQA